MMVMGEAIHGRMHDAEDERTDAEWLDALPSVQRARADVRTKLARIAAAQGLAIVTRVEKRGQWQWVIGATADGTYVEMIARNGLVDGLVREVLE